MDYSASNSSLWSFVLSFGVIAGAMLLSNFLLRKIAFLRKTLTPTAVLAGFVLLLLRELQIIRIDVGFFEKVTYHAIALGFIAMTLRTPNGDGSAGTGERLMGLKSGAVIIGSYLIQGIVGLAITIALGYTVMPGLFKAAGILLPMGFGQGPGQANNVGSTFQQLGFTGGQSFGLSIAAAGYLCACTVGVIYLAILRKRGAVAVREHEAISGSVSVDMFQDDNEIPISQSVDRFSMQVAMVVLIYLLTYLVSLGLTSFLTRYAPALGKTLNSIIWGFNFVVGSVVAMLWRALFKAFTKAGVMTRQYPNNYLLNRISGAAFDFMIVCGIAAIDISDLKGLWLPFVLIVAAGGLVTLLYLRQVCRRVYKGYYYEGFFSMYGMMTGTISSGVLLLREIDPYFTTPAAGNLITGSSFAILLGAPILVFIGLAPQSTVLLFVTFGLLIFYFAALMFFLFRRKNKRAK